MKKNIFAAALIALTTLSLGSCESAAQTSFNGAADYFKSMYLNDGGTSTGSFSKASFITYEGEKYDVKWEVSKYTEGRKLEDVITITDDNTYSYFNVNYVDNTSAAFDYTLKATLYSPDEKLSQSFEYNYTVPKIVYATYDQWLDACKNKKDVTIRGKVVGRTPFSKKNLYVEDNEGHGYYAYTCTFDSSVTTDNWDTKLAVGTEVVVAGTGTVYNGTYEFNKNCSVIIANNQSSPLTTPDYIDATADFKAATSNTDESLLKYQTTKVKLTNCVVYEIDGSNFRFTVDGAEQKGFYTYQSTSYFTTDAQNKVLFAKLSVGTKFNLTGVCTYYNGYVVYPDTDNSFEVIA